MSSARARASIRLILHESTAACIKVIFCVQQIDCQIAKNIRRLIVYSVYVTMISICTLFTFFSFLFLSVCFLYST